MRTLTFLFADIRDYTAFVERHGDLAAKSLIADYRGLVRAEIGRASGAEIKTEGDSFYVVFEAASDAVRCGISILRQAERYSRARRDRPMTVGVGIHSGEPQEDGGQYVGAAVIIAARLAQQADAGELLITDVVRGLLPKDAPPARKRTGLTLKGIAEAPGVLALDWTAGSAAAPVASIVGRDEEVEAIAQLMADPSYRLITLTGTGGVGKTRLAIALAERVADGSPDGTRFVDLSLVRDPALVALAIVETIQIPEAPTRSLEQAIVAALRDREMTLVLDNFEQVIEAAPLVGSVLSKCPRIRILLTSREPLHLKQEHVVVVQPLASDPAVALFLARAHAAGADIPSDPQQLESVAEICRRLDRLPLAIELVAARARHLSPGAVLRRLATAFPLLERGARDLPPRQQTLAAAIGWSYELLRDDERAMFRRCAAFAGGFTADAASVVCAREELDSDAMLQVLISLADKNLLQVDSERSDDEPRFRLLETIREFALDQLSVMGESDDIRRRHAMFFRNFAEYAVPHLQQADQPTWLDRLYREYSNLRASLLWCVETGEVDWGLRLATALWPFWFMRGALTEGRDVLERLLAVPAERSEPGVRSAGLNTAGTMARYQGDLAAADRLITEALHTQDDPIDTKATADCLNNLGYVTLQRGDYERARSLFEDALRTYRQRGDQQGMADSLSHLALIALHKGDRAIAHGLEEEALDLWRALGDLQGIAWALEGLGKVQLDAGQHSAAIASFREGLEVARAIGHGWAIALLIDGFACAFSSQGQADRAVRLAGAAEAIRKRTGTPLAPMHERQLHRWLEKARLTLRPARAEQAYEAGRRMSLDEAIADATSTEAMPTRVSAGPEEPSPLSGRELEVVTLVAHGLTNKQIAQRLFIATGTVERHVANILGKLDMGNRTQAATWAAARGLLQESVA